MDHSDPTEKPFVAAEDAVLDGFSTLLNQAIINIRLTFYRSYPSNPGQHHSCLCILSAAQAQPQCGTCNVFAYKLLLFLSYANNITSGVLLSLMSKFNGSLEHSRLLRICGY